MTQLDLMGPPTVQIDFFDTVILERLNKRGLAPLLPLVSRVLRTPAEADRAVSDLLGRMRAGAPIPSDVGLTTPVSQVTVPRRPHDYAVVEGFLDLLSVGLAFARTEEQQSFIFSAAHLIEDLRRRMVGVRAIGVGESRN